MKSMRLSRILDPWKCVQFFLNIPKAFDKVWHEGLIFLNIPKAFDKVWHEGLIFLNIPKAFDKVWHEGLIFKLKQNDVYKLLKFFESYLHDRKQRAVLNGYYSGYSGYSEIKSVPIYINDLERNIKCNIKFIFLKTQCFLLY